MCADCCCADCILSFKLCAYISAFTQEGLIYSHSTVGCSCGPTFTFRVFLDEFVCLLMLQHRTSHTQLWCFTSEERIWDRKHRFFRVSSIDLPLSSLFHFVVQDVCPAVSLLSTFTSLSLKTPKRGEVKGKGEQEKNIRGEREEQGVTIRGSLFISCFRSEGNIRGLACSATPNP